MYSVIKYGVTIPSDVTMTSFSHDPAPSHNVRHLSRAYMAETSAGYGETAAIQIPYLVPDSTQQLRSWDMHHAHGSGCEHINKHLQ